MIIGKTIDTDATYTGDEFAGLTGARVRICAILHESLGADTEAHCFVVSDAVLGYVGGVSARDRAEVVRLRPDGRPGVVHFAVRAIDLACFAQLAEDDTVPDTVRNPDLGGSPMASQTSKEAP